MRRLLAVLGLALAVPVYADCVWSSTGLYSVKVVCGDGDEVAPTLVTEGLSLDVPSGFFADPAQGFSVTAAADSTRTITSGTLKAYTWDTNAAAWARCPDLDLTVTEAGGRYLSWSGFTVTSPKGRIAYIPSVVVLSAGGITLYLTASP